MLKIALSMIVKDDSEVKDLEQSLYSVLPYVDYAQITSNGKKTAEIERLIESTRGIFPKITIDYSHLPWNKDFSEQRNHSFNRIPEGFDYIYWQDADDYLVGGEFLQELATTAKKNGKDVVFLAYWYGCTFKGDAKPENFLEVDIEHYRERLIRPGTIKWVGRLHETPVPVSGQKNNYTKYPYNEKVKPIAVMHTATIDDSLEKLSRNREILELQLDDERQSADGADPRTLLYLMKIYSEVGDNETLTKCIEMGHEYLDKSGWDEERANACDIMAICSTKLGKYVDSIQYLHRAINEYPHQPLLYIRLALAYYNTERYREAKHWLNIGVNMDLDRQTAGINNIKEMKVLTAQLLLKIAYHVDKDVESAYEAAQLLLKEQPTKENQENLNFIYDRKALKDASEQTLKLLKYFEEIGDKDTISRLLDTLPTYISEQPFAIKHRQKVTKPRVWKENEICYFANFGGKHFEKWDGNSKAKGIGGSETAVISLAEKWTKQGYKVTVYGDPQQPCEINGVTYLPWYHFNKADKFNVFIQWRSPYLAPVIKSRKFIVDLHDVVNQVDYPYQIINAIDEVMVKSEYHKAMLPELSKKIKVVSNGINL